MITFAIVALSLLVFSNYQLWLKSIQEPPVSRSVTPQTFFLGKAPVPLSISSCSRYFVWKRKAAWKHEAGAGAAYVILKTYGHTKCLV